MLDRRPRVILWYNTAGAREPYYLGDHELADNPFFRFFYQLKTTTLPPIGGADPYGVVDRFFGFPFGTTPRGKGRWAEMGLSGTFKTTPVPLTTLYEAPIVANYFERELRDDTLWPLKTEFAHDLDGFVEAVSRRWAEKAPDEGRDAGARALVEAMCADARRRIEAGDYPAASEVLAAAAQRNQAARSPLVYQYIANVAVLTGDLFTAVVAQKEALRLAPTKPLYHSNLKNLLAVRFKEGTKAARP